MNGEPPATAAAVPPKPLREKFRLRFAAPDVEAQFLAEHRRELVPAARWALVVALVLGLAFMWQDNELSPYGYRATNIRVYLLAPMSIAAWYAFGLAAAPRFIEPAMALYLLLYAAMVAAITLVFEPGFYGLSGSVAEGNFIMIVLATFTLSCLRLAWATPVALGVVLIYSVCTALWTDTDPVLFLNGHFSNMMMTVALGVSTCWMLETLRRRQFLARLALHTEKERYKELLYNLVPSKIANRIEGGEFPIADSHAEIAVLFSDLVGFTTLTQQIAPRMLVQLLNELFFQFDLAAERHGVEKIKTIGDGYMAACGPPVEEEKRTVMMARLALEMIDITRNVALEYKLPIGVRIGIHSGSLVAGVIGKNRYTYDMWGDSVNMASRMESSGLPNRVQVSESAYQRLTGHFDFEPRGTITVKGIGDVTAYLIAEPLTPPPSSATVDWNKYSAAPLSL